MAGKAKRSEDIEVTVIKRPPLPDDPAERDMQQIIRDHNDLIMVMGSDADPVILDRILQRELNAWAKKNIWNIW